MSQETEPQIRPIWLVGGGLAAVILGACALISVCSAVALIWFTAGRSSSTDRATLTAAQEQTDQRVVILPTQVTRTPLPLQTTLPPTPTRLVIVTLVTNSTSLPSAPSSAPDQAVRTYYQLVSDQRYDQSWQMLSDSFRQTFNCCAPTYNYSGYVHWWDSVNYVDFGSIRTVSQSQDRAVVYAEMYFVMNTGARSGLDSNPYIHLVYDPIAGSWRFDDKRASP